MMLTFTIATQRYTEILATDIRPQKSINQLKNENTLERTCKPIHNDMILYREKASSAKSRFTKLHTTMY